VKDVDLAMLFPGFQCSVININDYISEEALEKMGQDKRKRQKVLFEIINTEKSYVARTTPSHNGRSTHTP
jgi:hypothetical protein